VCVRVQAGELLGTMQAVVSRYVAREKRGWSEWGAVLAEAQQCLDEEVVAPRESPTAPAPFQAPLRLPHSAVDDDSKVRPSPWILDTGWFRTAPHRTAPVRMEARTTWP
jgi:hypothetical protein